MVGGSIASSAMLPGTFHTLSTAPGQLGRYYSRPGRHLLLGRRRHPSRRKRGRTLYGAGMHYDPLISSRVESSVRWGHPPGSVRALIVAFPAWAPSKVFALPIAMPVPQPPRADQGEKESEGEKGSEEIHQTQARSESSHST